MRASTGLGKSAAAATGFGIALVFALCGTALAWQGDLQAEPLHGARQAGAGREILGGGREIPAEDAALCGKCHSACEEGRIHLGLPGATLPAGTGLPLGSDGRTACFTCHRPHGGAGVTGDALLRMSNLRRELCLVCHREGDDDRPRVAVVSPPERSIVQEERLALIGTISTAPAQPLAVRLNGARFQLPVRGKALFTWLKLQDGVNRIEIVQGERVLWAGEVFHGEGASSGYGRSSVGHCTGSREECLGCHDAEGARIAGSAGNPSALCYGCHDRFEGKRYLHGPLAVGACLACHDPHSGYGAAHLRAEQTLLCGNCHAPRETAATAACNAMGKACSSCHDPHQSDTRYLLKGPKYTMRGGAPAGR